MNLIKDQYHTLKVGFGRRRTGKTVQYRILYHDLTEKTAYTATGVVEIGDGDYGVRLSIDEVMSGYVQWNNVTDSITVSEPVSVIDDVVTNINSILTKVTAVHKIETGRWKIVSNQMIFYDDDDTTPLFTFDLLDSSGSGTMSSPVERTPA